MSPKTHQPVFGPGPFKHVPRSVTAEVPSGTHGLLQDGQNAGWLACTESQDTWIWPGAGWQTFTLGEPQLGAPNQGTVYLAGVLAPTAQLTFAASQAGGPLQAETPVQVNGNLWVHQMLLDGVLIGWFTRWVDEGQPGGGQLDWYVTEQFVDPQSGLIALTSGQTLLFQYIPQDGSTPPGQRPPWLPPDGAYRHLRQLPA